MRTKISGTLVAVIIFCVGLCSCENGASGLSPLFIQRVTNAFKSSVTNNGFPGAVLGLMRESDGASMFVATGMSEAVNTEDIDQSNWVTKTAMTTGTKTRIASVTKPFTATLILMLVDEGLLSLDQTIDEFYPDLVPNSSIITIENLLNMTSGIYDHELYPPLDEATICGDLTIYYTPEELIAMSNAYGGGTSMFAPGEYYFYSNTNFLILAMIAQKVTGRTYKELITERIIDPLALSGTSVPGDAQVDMPSPFTYGYGIPSLNPDSLCGSYTSWVDNYAVQNMSWDLGAGNIVSTAQDLLTLLHALLGGDLISSGLLELMLTPSGKPDFTSGAASVYGLGIMKTASGIIGHEGANSGYNTLITYFNGYYYSIFVNASPNMSSGGEQVTTSVDNIFADVLNAVSQL